MQCAQNVRAYVNAGFLVQIKRDIISYIRICYGGINPKFVHATNTERLLIGKELHCNQTLQVALHSLSNEIHPDWMLPDASPEYRKNLALALFYRFVLSTCNPSKLSPYNLSGTEPLERPLSSGTQTFNTFKNKWPLTQPVEKYEGLVQCSGELKYSNDLPRQEGELWAAFVTAKHVNTILGSIDPTHALVGIY